VLEFDSTANQQLAIGNSPKSAMPLGYHTHVSTPLKPTKNIQPLPTLDPTLKGGGRIKFERRVTLLSLAAGFPAVSLCAFLLWYDNYSAQVQWTVDLLLILVWLGVSFNLKQRIVRPLQTLSNILAAIREGDYSIRGRRALSGDALGEVMLEVNDLGQTLREQRLGAMEATALLRTVMAEIDVVVFAFDGEQRLRLVNRAGERLLAQPSARLLGRTSRELGLDSCLNRPEGSAPYTLQMVFPGGVGRWDVRRSTFREGGAPHQLLVLTDLSQTLREEERTAWQRLLRVLGHELNNSLAPIKSVAGSLADLMGREPEPPDWREGHAPRSGCYFFPRRFTRTFCGIIFKTCSLTSAAPGTTEDRSACIASREFGNETASANCFRT
jgi:PAS domain-containing protein